MTAVEIGADEALRLRMVSLLLGRPPAASGDAVPEPATVADVVTWFGAMQAQDLNSVMWSLGARLPGSTAEDVHAALERREAVRTWPMRGTVHLIPARDAHWMLEVMGERALAGAQRRRAGLGLDLEVAERAVDVLANALSGGARLTRAECLQVLVDAGIQTSGQRGYHLLWYASQRGVTCIAPNIGTEQSFVLLDEWVPDPRRLDRDEALALIALRYFQSHGPATRRDFAGWTGLTLADARRGIAGAGAQLATVRVDGQEMVVGAAVLAAYLADPGAVRDAEVLALPGFDEYLLGFKDRSLMLAEEHKQAIVPGGNGVFQPTVVRSGRVVGTWKRVPAKNRAAVRVQPLAAVRAADRKRVERAFEAYARFVGGPLEVSWA
jgi:hypothetical protein